jgi:ankyrin repeat protein
MRKRVQINKASKLLGHSPLYDAAANGHTRCVKILLGHKPDVNQRTFAGDNALFVASAQGYAEVRRYIYI